MEFAKELEYNLEKISALGAYPLHLLLIILFYMMGLVNESLFLLAGFIILHLIGTPLRLLAFRKREHPLNQEIFFGKYRASSFPSYHTARMTFFALFFSKMFNYKLDVVILLSFLIIIVAASRVMNKNHFVSDIIGGFGLGILMYVIPSLLPII